MLNHIINVIIHLTIFDIFEHQPIFETTNQSHRAPTSMKKQYHLLSPYIYISLKHFDKHYKTHLYIIFLLDCYQ